jgi:hypothetical protein
MKSPLAIRPIATTLASISGTLVGLASIYGGTALMVDPTGSTLAVSSEFLAKLPVGDYELMGVFLLAIGLGFVASSLGLWRNFAWGWPTALTMNIILGGWLLLGLALIGLHFAHQPILLLAVIWNIYLLFRPSSLKHLIS